MPTETLRSEVIKVAEEHADLADDELLALLEYEWERAGLAIADRGEREYLRSVRDSLVRQLIQQRETVTVINALLADHAISWAADHHIADHRYALVIGLLVAWSTRAVLRRPGDKSDDDEPDPGAGR